jgi:hypothetical protein
LKTSSMTTTYPRSTQGWSPRIIPYSCTLAFSEKLTDRVICDTAAGTVRSGLSPCSLVAGSTTSSAFNSSDNSPPALPAPAEQTVVAVDCRRRHDRLGRAPWNEGCFTKPKGGSFDWELVWTIDGGGGGVPGIIS